MKKMLASKDNKTLHITKGKEYDMLPIGKTHLAIVENDKGDNVTMSTLDFDEMD